MVEFLYITNLIFSSVVLLYASIIDLKFKKIENWVSIFLIMFGVINRLVFQYNDFYIPTLFLFLFGYLLWRYNILGAGDAKIMASLGPLLPYHGFGSMTFTIGVFILTWSILVTIYTGLYMWQTKRDKDRIPLVPVILMAYLITCFFLIH